MTILPPTDNSTPWQGTLLFGTAEADKANGIALDSSGNIYITGKSEGDLDGNISAGKSDIILMKYTSSGVKLWTKQFGTPYTDRAFNMTINKKENSDDDIFITGYTFGNLDGKANSNEGVSSDIFIMKFNTSGEVQ
ncbi:MAG: hypothetical protein GY754_15300 [bacterium]|nr:hypothetical protein [bacterium]